jgi:hypothetical protein
MGTSGFKDVFGYKVKYGIAQKKYFVPYKLCSSYGVLGANISSQAMLFAKSGLELLLLTVFHHDNQFIYPLTWMIVFALIFTAVIQVTY